MPLSRDELRRIDAYWRAANYLGARGARAAGSVRVMVVKVGRAA